MSPHTTTSHTLEAEQDARIRDIEDVYRTLAELRLRVTELEAKQQAAAVALTQQVAPIWDMFGRISDAILDGAS